MVAPRRLQGITSCCKFLLTLLIVYLASVPFGIFAEEFADLLLCRKCGHEVARASNVITVPSKLAHRQRNDTVSGVDKVLIQLFKNPDGLFFEVITVNKAELYTDSNKFMYMTWFPGYSWAVSVCPKCGSHIGWQYEVEEPDQHTDKESPKQFIGLIYDKILEHLGEGQYEVEEPDQHTDKESPKQFIGLIYDKILEHLDADNLILIPKAYKS